MTVVISLLGIALLVFLHELGHFSVALAVGVRPRSFYVGFPPPLVKVVRNGIEYGIGMIPLGGLVRIPGMHRPAGADFAGQMSIAVRDAPELQEPVTVVQRRLDAGDFNGARAALGPLRAALEQAKLGRVTQTTANRAVRDLDEGSVGDAYWRQPTWKRIAIILAGPVANIVVAIILFTWALMLTQPTYRLGFTLNANGTHAGSRVTSTVKGAPARQMGLRVGDRVVVVNGTPVAGDAIRSAIERSHGRPIALVVVRHGDRVRLGPAKPDYLPGYSFGGALGQAFHVSGNVITGTLGAIVHLPQRHKDVHSAVGIVKASDQAVKAGMQDYLAILGLISLSLGVLNLLPLLPLDGGHILFSLIEAARGGRAVRREVYERVSAIGIAAVLLLVFVGLSNDIHVGGG